MTLSWLNEGRDRQERAASCASNVHAPPSSRRSARDWGRIDDRRTRDGLDPLPSVVLETSRFVRATSRWIMLRPDVQRRPISESW